MQDDTKHVKIHSEPRLELEFNACLDARPEAGTCLPDGLLRDGVPRHADGGLEVIDIPMRRSIWLLFHFWPPEKIKHVEVGWGRRPIRGLDEVKSVRSESVLRRFCGVAGRAILLPHHVRCRTSGFLFNPRKSLFLKKVLIDFGVYLQALRDENRRHFLPIAPENTQNHDACGLLRFVHEFDVATLVFRPIPRILPVYLAINRKEFFISE